MPPLYDGALIDTIDLSVEQTVRRSLVHKRSIENVLLTGIRACAHDLFLCAGRVPTAHRFFNDAGRTPHSDILFYTELGRQASLAVSHAFLDVAAEDIFIFEGSEASVTDAARTESFHGAPDLVIVEVKIGEMTRRRNNAVSRVVAEHRMSVGDKQVFHGTGAWTVQPSALYQRLRRASNARTAPAATDRVPPGPVENVVITPAVRVDDPAGFVASLVVDHRHPYFFDHPCDHVPGMLLLEGCAQLALAAFAETTSTSPGASAIGAYDVNFAQFVECGLPTTLAAQVNVPDSTVPITISQHNGVAGTAAMQLTPTA